MALTSPKMKVCTRCPERGEQPIENFGILKRSKDGRRGECKSCRSEEAKARWADLSPEAKAAVNARTNELKDIRRQFVVDYLAANPCVDCGESDIVVLEFDHVRGIKLAEVSSLIHSQASLDRLRVEIEKCDVVCANCHRRRTASRGNHYRLRLVA